jgi:hypothetical protein
MASVLKKLLIGVAVGCLVFLPGSRAQVRKRSICGKVLLNGTNADAKTQVTLDYPGIELNPGIVTNPDGTFCIDNYVADTSRRTKARLFVASFCRANDLIVMPAPFWPVLRKQQRFAGKDIIIDPEDITNVPDLDLQLIYGHVDLEILDHHHQPLLTKASDWSPVWIRVLNKNGVSVYESGLSPRNIQRAVDLRNSRIQLAVPQGTWTLEVSMAGFSSNSTTRRTVKWLKVPGKLQVDSCGKPVNVALSVPPTKKFSKN